VRLAVLLSTAELARIVVRRRASLLEADVQEHLAEAEEQIKGRRVLVVGGAGSIGSATVIELAALAPQQLHIVDIDENALTELVRDLRSRHVVATQTELRTTPLDAGSPSMQRLVEANRGYDLVLNFAAIKHVRSEKDVFSLLRMLDVNLRLPRALLESVTDTCDRYFAVSTDKAANPVNLMGASKRALEHVIFDEPLGPQVSSARFANVAFSQGSLLDGWMRRLAKGQPWAVPRDVRRYFVAPAEAGQLCMLAATLGPTGHVVIPRLNPESELRDLVDVAEDVLSALGLRPLYCSSEEEARQAAQRRHPGSWPVLVTALDTTGEKPSEEFVAKGETALECGFASLQAVRPAAARPETIQVVLNQVLQWLNDPRSFVDEAAVVRLLRELVPELDHRRTTLGLDGRM
jgi:FlaA1/EpsC-like NDP-sugar epimerase